MKLPTDLSGRQLCRALEKIGFVYQRQKGSHIVLRRSDPYARVTVPDHKSIRPGTLRQILHEAGIAADDLLKLL
jgi:predicted RNA binding protein YcfA (HicA-like mRNA interferase family)